jgi:hypothetical protein
MEIIHEERDRLFHLHGTTMKGLQLEYGADINRILDYVHDVDLTGIIVEDPALRQVLIKLPQQSGSLPMPAVCMRNKSFDGWRSRPFC